MRNCHFPLLENFHEVTKGYMSLGEKAVDECRMNGWKSAKSKISFERIIEINKYIPILFSAQHRFARYAHSSWASPKPTSF